MATWSELVGSTVNPTELATALKTFIGSLTVLADTSSVQTLTNKRIDTPKIGTSLLDINGNTMLAFTATASAVNYFTIRNTAGSSALWLTASGTAPNLDVTIQSKGAGGFNFQTSALNILQLFPVANPVNWLQLNNAAANTPIAFYAVGGDPNVSIDFYGKGDGRLKAGGQNVLTTTSTDAGIANKTFTAPKITGGSNTAALYAGTGSPEGVVTATGGSHYMRTDGGAGTSFYVKETASGNTGWAAK